MTASWWYIRTENGRRKEVRGYSRCRGIVVCASGRLRRVGIGWTEGIWGLEGVRVEGIGVCGQRGRRGGEGKGFVGAGHGLVSAEGLLGATGEEVGEPVHCSRRQSCSIPNWSKRRPPPSVASPHSPVFHCSTNVTVRSNAIFTAETATTNSHNNYLSNPPPSWPGGTVTIIQTMGHRHDDPPRFATYVLQEPQPISAWVSSTVAHGAFRQAKHPIIPVDIENRSI